MVEDIKINVGFPPIYNKQSKILILGSFPSVQSRKTQFYYGNKRNRFWRTLCGYFKEEIPQTLEEKCEFLIKKGIALWDMVLTCNVEGSSDTSIKNIQIVDLNWILDNAPIEKILLNGTLAFELYEKHYGHLSIPYEKMPSTSPANPRYDESVWRKALDDVFKN